MTTKEAIRELKIVRNYCNAKSIPAIDYAIRALREKADQEMAHTSRRPAHSRTMCAPRSALAAWTVSWRKKSRPKRAGSRRGFTGSPLGPGPPARRIYEKKEF